MVNSIWNAFRKRKTNNIIPEYNQQASYHVQYSITAIVSLSVFFSGLQYGWPSPSLPYLKKRHELTEDQTYWIISMLPFGSIVFSILFPFLSDTIGGKLLILFTAFGHFTAWVLIGFMENVEAIYIARFCAGLCDGICFITPMYLGEIVDSKIRGTMVSVTIMSFVLGPLVINILEIYIDIYLVAKIFSVWPIIFFGCALWMPESPYFLVIKKRDEEAKETLQWLRGTTAIHEEYNRISEAISNKVEFKELFLSKQNRRGLVIVVILRMIQQLIGSSVIMFHLQEILQETGYNISPSTTASIYLAIQNIFSLVSLNFADNFGRKPLLIFSLILTGILMFIVGTYFFLKIETEIDIQRFSYMPVFALMMYRASISVGLQKIPAIYTSEVFTPQMKGFANAICSVAYNVGILIGSEFFTRIKQNFEIYFSFYGFALVAFVGLFFVIYYLPETKGKTIEEIQEELK
ncbi:hypothetical protein HHI36_012310 [Cryptolaemus montrouzieri]|uniref:Major facilitator superfamily (MFS) profile domain-containing protein n=1 Tax=Cryptolaemus montrouzieri TaxID=559131 RepID=A0ABD2NDW7_9CUCU